MLNRNHEGCFETGKRTEKSVRSVKAMMEENQGSSLFFGVKVGLNWSKREVDYISHWQPAAITYVLQCWPAKCAHSCTCASCLHAEDRWGMITLAHVMLPRWCIVLMVQALVVGMKNGDITAAQSTGCCRECERVCACVWSYMFWCISFSNPWVEQLLIPGIFSDVTEPHK